MLPIFERGTRKVKRPSAGPPFGMPRLQALDKGCVFRTGQTVLQDFDDTRGLARQQTWAVYPEARKDARAIDSLCIRKDAAPSLEVEPVDFLLLDADHHVLLHAGALVVFLFEMNSDRHGAMGDLRKI